MYGDARSGYKALEVSQSYWAGAILKKFIWLGGYNLSLDVSIRFLVINTFFSFFLMSAEGLDLSPLLIKLAWIKFWPKAGTSWTQKQWVLCIYFPPPTNPNAQCLSSGFYNNPLEMCNTATFYYVYGVSTLLSYSSNHVVFVVGVKAPYFGVMPRWVTLSASGWLWRHTG